MDFDTEAFIFEVQSRPALWDATNEDYNNRLVRQRRWEEMVERFGGEEISEEEKKELSELSYFSF